MIYCTDKSFYLLLFINYIKFVSLYSHEYSENLLDLNFPKLISILNTTSENLNFATESNRANDTFVKSNTETIHDFDKRYKNKIYPQDDLEDKKNKNKIAKKKRLITNNDVLINVKDSLVAKDSLDVSLVKSRKLTNKSKKKNKRQIENANYDSSLIKGFNNSTNVNPQSLDFVKHSNTISINNPLTVDQLSLKLSIPEAEIITYLFLEKGISATMNQVLDVSTARQVALKYNFVLSDPNKDNNTNLIDKNSLKSYGTIIRPPIITILGHVDHGKTTLLDSILNTNIVLKESGGITQSISGYEIKFNYNSKIYELVFLDTPGHESFKAMRIRGSKVTDIVLLVIACNDGVKPQTIEAIQYIKDMNLNYIVVITKADNCDQNIDSILQDLANYDLICEKWGGSTKVIQVSALTGRNIQNLLIQICLFSEAKNFVANPDQLASGTIFESYLDKKKGPVAYVVVQNGTLKIGDIVVASNIYGKVKSLIDLSSQKVLSAFPSSIIQLLGFSDLPNAGSTFQVYINEKEAKKLCINSKRQSKNLGFFKGLSINNSLSQSINSNMSEVALLIKADSQGSLEAIIDLLFSLPQLKVKLHIVSATCGIISNNDIELALLTNAIIVTFNINISSSDNNLAKKRNLIFKNFLTIYDLYDYVESLMLDLIEPSYDRVFIGSASVRTVFNINNGTVAGCYVEKGKLIKMCYLSVHRQDKIVYEGSLNSLKIMKDDVAEVLSGNECGLMSDYNLWQKDDLIDAYQLVPLAKTLV